LKLIISILFLFANTIWAQKVVIISDLNGSYGSTDYSSHVSKAVKKIKEIKPDIILITGDMVAGMKSGLDYHAMWDSFFNVVIDPLNGFLIAPTPGNHDASAYSKYYEERLIFKTRFPKSKSSLKFISSKNYPFTYSFKVKDSLFVSLDVTVPGKLPKKQMDWLKQQLSKRDDYKSIVVFSYLPLYPFAQKRENDAMFNKDLERLLNDNNVEYYLSGHHHSYYPGKRGNLKLISQSCLGGGAPYLIGDDSRSAKSLTIIDLDKSSVKALKAPSFTQEVDHQSLPSVINEGDFQIRRID
jgi:3',5'-cyclic AMP phosphodiesterase CpdA